MADVAHGQHVADDAVAVCGPGRQCCSGCTPGPSGPAARRPGWRRAHVVGIVVEGQGAHVQLAGGAVGGLAVEPDQGLLRVGDLGGGGAGGRGWSRRRAGCCSRRWWCAAAGGQAQRHGSGQRQCKNLFHDNSPFPKVPQGSFVPCVLQSYLKALLTKKQGKKHGTTGKFSSNLYDLSKKFGKISDIMTNKEPIRRQRGPSDCPGKTGCSGIRSGWRYPPWGPAPPPAR